MKRTPTTDFEQRAGSELTKMSLEEGFEKDFVFGGDWDSQITPKQRIALWGLIIKYGEKFPSEMQDVIEQVFYVYYAQMEIAVTDIENSTRALTFKLKNPYRS